MPDTQHRPITVSIVSHGQHELLLPLLEQLDRYCGAVVDTVVLTVNIPESKMLPEEGWRFRVQRIVNARPQGFGANHNAAFKHCRSQWFLVLNPDIRFDHDVLQPLLSEARPDSGILTPRIIEPGSRHTGPEPHRSLLTPYEILTRSRFSRSSPKAPAWIPGMFMLLRAKAFRQVHGFDGRFFMYGEDFDLCARLALSGWRIQVAEELQITHNARRASRVNWRHLNWHIASLLKVWGSKSFWAYRTLLRRQRNPESDNESASTTGRQ
jgi:N-acetylglucosaminyl-diphospho-decaprenol L-rhamnosyltransferase